MNKKLLTYLAFCLLIAPTFAQKQGNIWYFGRNAGLDFNSGTPVALTDGQINTYEGCATLADQNGQLLFYTDGISVWNRNHRRMPNGTGLHGNPSATQSGVIVPVPQNPDQYLVFTVDELAGPNGLQYSVVDMTLDGGQGDITTKNRVLLAPSTEKVSAAVHANQQDFWVVTHPWESNAFYAYRVTEAGVDAANPVISSVGAVHGSSELSSAGYLKISPDGSRLALALPQGEGSLVEAFDFDNTSGRVSNPTTLTGFREVGTYGIEFSPNGQLLYVSDANLFEVFVEQGLYQYDLTAPNVAASRVEVATDIALTGLQIATDGKIYVSRASSEYLGVINQPDQVSMACDYVSDGIYLGGRTAEYGLPTFIQSFFLQVDFEVTGQCAGEPTQFTLNDDSSEGTLLWNFDDPASGEANTSAEANPAHVYATPGLYTVSLTVTDGEASTTTTQEVAICAAPVVDLGNDTTLAYGETLTLVAGDPTLGGPTLGDTYRWQDGSTGGTFTVSELGKYWVDAMCVQGCVASDTIYVSYDQLIESGLNDTIVCAGASIRFDVSQEGATYQWQDGSTNSTSTATEAGIYWVDITNAFGNRTERDSATVSYRSFGVPQIPDTSVCGGTVTLMATGATEENERYRWYEAEDSATPLAENEGPFTTPNLTETTTYYVALTDGVCEGERVPVTVTIEAPEAQITPAEVVIQYGESVQLQGNGGVKYQWSPSTGLDNDTIANPVASPGDNVTYTLTVTTEGGCQASVSVPIIVQRALTVPNAITPDDDGVNDTWVIEHLERFPGNHVRIFNRAGSLLFATNNYDQSWRGTYQGKELPQDTYFYVISRNDGHNPQRGTISIIR